MRFARAHIETIAYELPSEAVATRDLEAQLAPLYRRFGLPDGHIEALTGVIERRFWPRGFDPADGAARAAFKALAATGVRAAELDALIYAGVCRTYLEPATACVVAARLGVAATALVYDLGNACLGMLNGILDLAGRVERGEIRAGLVVACESAREINEATVASLLARSDRDRLTQSLATFTGGSGAAAVLVSDGARGGHRLHAAAWLNDVQHHRLCRWQFLPSEAEPGRYEHAMTTDAVSVLRHGTALAQRTWRAFLEASGWQPQDVGRVVPHQVGKAHRQQLHHALELRPDQDVSTFPLLGNIGSVSVPLTAALAAERGRLVAGDTVGLLGIGSGLSCLMIGATW